MEEPRTAERRGRQGWTALAIAGGTALLLVGLAFHGLAAHHRPTGDDPLAADQGWAFLRWGWLRLAAWAAVAGGAWAAAVGWTTRRRVTVVGTGPAGDRTRDDRAAGPED